MSRISAALSALALFGALASNPAEAVQRVFVASYGSDGNTATNCGIATPCRTFTAAMTVVDPGGEVVALDAAGYGAVTITKSVTLTANPGFYAGVAAASGNAVTIATASVNVILRGLNINGVGATDGVVMTNGSQLSIENCVISNFSANGVSVTTGATIRIVDSLIRDNTFYGVNLENGATATITGTKIMGSGTAGVYAYGSPTATTTTAVISDSNISANFVGVWGYTYVSGANVRVSVSRSTVSNNGYGIISESGSGGSTITTASNNLVTRNTNNGLYQFGTGVFESLQNNTSRQNGNNTFGTITNVGGL